jgi:hypothetical protein
MPTQRAWFLLKLYAPAFGRTYRFCHPQWLRSQLSGALAGHAAVMF